MGNDINNQPSFPKITIFSNCLPSISAYPLLTISNTKFFLSIKHLNISSNFNSLNHIFVHFLSNYEIYLIKTTTHNIYLFLIHLRFIKEHIYFSIYNNTNDHSLLKANNNCFSITISPSIQNELPNEMNQTFDLNSLYQKGMRLNKDKRMNTIISNRELENKSQNANTLKFSFYSKKSKSLMNEEDCIKGKSIDEVYEEYLKRRYNKKRKEEVILFNQRNLIRNAINKK